MLAHIPSHLSNLPIYKQALLIFILSRSISNYLSQDLAHLEEDGSEDEHIYFSGDIVQHSISLAPEIINAEMERFSEKKHKHIAAIRFLTSRLYSHCRRLEKCNSNGKDYIPILRKELKIFKKLQNSWMHTL
ncbi:hypothetical protein KO494_11975 [Lacinutrix sp. C3R15]|uniref:hypothetical protein n=1 Tax=Flavobacteriaceae TaxID=49546 RepID=UPI001C081A7C|nr:MULTISPECIES: hypothetical protein [Flavobacteriaceae]MBU2940256.1 hypothetical protein [Lacinutrix sp. C3R15]MDO6623575.1 hypothetical protein [Oceanihabitans sp. 1_MG-2023]